jgi:hypothetical protein
MADRESINGVAWTSLTEDQSGTQNTYDFLLRDDATHERLAQTFEVGTTTDLAAVELSLQRHGSPSGDIWVEIWYTNSDLPYGGAVQTSIPFVSYAISSRITVSDISDSSYQVCKFYFPPGLGASMSLNTRYAIVLRGDFSGDSNNCIYWGFGNTSSCYANGRGCKYNSGTSLWSEAVGDGKDFWFKTYYGTANPVHFDKLHQISPEAGAWPVANGGGVPSGGVLVWTGAIANIPSGYVICDGGNGTFDLLDKFVKGVPDTSTDPSHPVPPLGEATHQLTTTEMPSHQHTAFTYQESGQAGAVRNVIHSGTQAYTGYTGGDGSHNNEPVYFHVAFIMKT